MISKRGKMAKWRRPTTTKEMQMTNNRHKMTKNTHKIAKSK